MSTIEVTEIAALKGRGYIQNKDKEHFSARVITIDGTLTSTELIHLAKAAQKFGNGKVAFTTRLTVEVQGLTYDTIEPFDAFIAEAGLYTGGTGARIRPIVSCKGSVCSHGLIDTQSLARELHEAFYIGWRDVQLPHKFKIGIGGCPNNCIKPALNDFGIMGFRGGYKIMLGGLWGKHQRLATPLEGIYTKEQVHEILKRTLLLYQEYGNPKERFGAMLDRVGAEHFISQLLDH